MALEAFLVNPYSKRKKRGTTSHRRKRGKGLPSALLKRMMRTYGPRQGMKHAWAEFRKGVTRNPWKDDAAGHRRASLKGWRRKRGSKRRKNPWESVHYRPRTSRLWRVKGTGRWERKVGQKNPFGEEVMIVGNRVRRRKRRRAKRRSLFSLNAPRRRRRSRRRRTYSYNTPRRKRYRRRFYSLNAPRRRRYHYNRKYRRRFRRNPAGASSLPAISFRNPMSLLMPAAFGLGGFMAADFVPTKLGMVSTWPRIGVKAGIAFGGAMVLGRFLGKRNGLFFAVGAGINLMNDLLKTFVFKTATVAGYGAFPYQMGAFPREFRGYSGYNGMDGYPYDVHYPM